MTIGLAYFFHVSSVGNLWHGRCGIHSMRRRKSTRSEARRRFSNDKRGTILSRLDFGRRPLSIALALGIAAAVISYLTVRASETRNAKSNTKHRARTDRRESESSPHLPRAPVMKAKVIDEFDHDPDAFTQGLVFHEGFFYESTGLIGRSSLRKVDVATGRVVNSRNLRRKDFGEGLALTGKALSRVIQVIWKVGKAYVYDTKSLREISSFSFQGDAWGLASHPGDSEKIFLSDGTSTIKLLRFEGNKFHTLREIIVRDGPHEVGLLNELEVVDDELWANVWMSDFVARIDIGTGVVKSWIDLRGILRKSAIPVGHTTDVLNGIAYDAASGAVYVTGKQWPKLYRISVTDEKIADNVSAVTNAFFLNPDKVAYVHQHVIA